MALVFFACSLMSKPMLVTMPFLLLMLDFYPLNRVPVERRSHAIRGLIFEKLPFFVLSMASSIVTYIAQQKGGAVVSLVKASIEARIANAFVSYASYLEKTLWPTELAVFYPYPEGIDLWRLLFSVSLVLGLSAVSLLYNRKFPCGAFGWFWFMGTLVPVIGVVQVGNQAMADRYSYVPLIGVFMVAACGITAACKRFSLPFWAPATVTVLLLSAYGVMASRQVAFWQNSGTLFRHALAVTRNNWPAYNNLGTWLSSNNSSSEAMECFERSLQIRPRNPEALYNIGNIFARAGDWETAINYYTQSLSVGPEEADTLNNLGFALTAMNRMDEAINCFERALRLDPDSPNTHNNLAAALHRQQRYEEAVRHYSLALRFMPDDPRIWTNLGDAQIRRGHVTEAIHAYEKAIKISPGDTQISDRLQALKQAMEQYIQAPSEEGRAPRQ
jgi:Flp pilus assembly protein TadD